MSDVEQGTDAWRQERLGKVTASRLADVLAKTKTGYGASRANYMAELIAERLTGQPAERFQNEAMRWGTEKEPEARAAYEFYRNMSVTTCGFVEHPRIAMSGASPDGLVGDDGLVEIKAPLTATHIETLLSGAIPAKYVAQMQWQMDCTGRSFCDFVSFDPRMPDRMSLFVKRLTADRAFQAEAASEVVAFLTELDAKVAALTERFARAA
jgi:putative phage-type endonuclease